MTNIILNIRGGSGSGKSTDVRQLMDHVGIAERLTRNGKTWAYRLYGGIFVFGEYESRYGGAENLRFAEIKEAVWSLASQGHVVFEGLLWSSGFKSSDELARGCAQHTIFALLDTPYELCIQRRAIRRRAPNGLDTNTAKLRQRFRDVIRAHEHLREVGHDTRLLPHNKALATILSWLGFGLLDCTDAPLHEPMQLSLFPEATRTQTKLVTSASSMD